MGKLKKDEEGECKDDHTMTPTSGSHHSDQIIVNIKNTEYDEILIDFHWITDSIYTMEELPL